MLQRPADEPTPVKTIQVKVIAPPGVWIQGAGENQPLPTVKVRGVISGALAKPAGP